MKLDTLEKTDGQIINLKKEYGIVEKTLDALVGQKLAFKTNANERDFLFFEYLVSKGEQSQYEPLKHSKMLEGLAPQVEEWLCGRIDQCKSSLSLLKEQLDYLEAYRDKFVVASNPNRSSGSNGCDNKEEDGCKMDEAAAANCLLAMAKVMAKVTK